MLSVGTVCNFFRCKTCLFKRNNSFFGILKNEFFYWRDWSGVGTDQFISELEEWLLYYDEGRPKQSLGWRTPREYRDSLAVKA
jgi:transposase InsO family protein